MEAPEAIAGAGSVSQHADLGGYNRKPPVMQMDSRGLLKLSSTIRIAKYRIAQILQVNRIFINDLELNQNHLLRFYCKICTARKRPYVLPQTRPSCPNIENQSQEDC